MKIAQICLLTACKRLKFKLFGDSSQVRAIDNGIMCCYWSASLSNRLRALKAHSSLLKCCAKNRLNYMYWIQGKHRGSWVWVFLRLSVSLKLIFIVPFNFYSISIFFFNFRGKVPLAGNSLRAEKSHWRVQKVTLAGPKSHTRAKMSQWSVIIKHQAISIWSADCIQHVSHKYIHDIMFIIDNTRKKCILDFFLVFSKNGWWINRILNMPLTVPQSQLDCFAALLC